MIELLDPVFSWTLLFPRWVSILVMAFIVVMIGNLAQKYLTDQKELKRIRERQKDLQKKMRELQKTNPKKAMKHQKELMQLNMDASKQSFRTMFYTFIPFMVIYFWMAANFAFIPLMPGDAFDVSAEVRVDGSYTLTAPFNITNSTQSSVEEELSWSLIAPEAGTYELQFSDVNGNTETAELVVGTMPSEGERKFATFGCGDIFCKINLGYDQVKPLGDFRIFGWNPKWLGTYIIFSIFMSLVSRKLMGIY